MPTPRRCRLVCHALALVLALGASAQPADYLDAELRARVEQLKADLAEGPTNATNARERADALWDWANAWALSGRYLPVNLTTAAHRYAISTDGGMRAIDAYVGELALLDEQPDAIGTLTADTGPFEARSWATFTQTWQVGSQDVTPAGGIAVAPHFMANHGTFQADDPAGDNYISIASSNADAKFVVDTVPLAGMHGGFRGARPVLFFRLDEGKLRSGDTVTVTYGDRSGGGRGLLMPTFSSDRMPFPLYVAFFNIRFPGAEPAAPPLFSLPIQPIRVTGGELAGVHAFAPSVVRPDEAFDIAIRAEDRFRNRAQPPYPGWRVYANGGGFADLPAGDEPIAVLRDVRFPEPGVYRISLAALDGSNIVGKGNPVLVSADAPRVFWGDTHGHSGFAEGIGTPERFMTWAKEDARLDFVTHSEHDIWLDDQEWEVLKRNVADFSEQGRFAAYLGYEWSSRNLYGGHHNVLFRTPEGRVRIPVQFFPTLSDLYFGLRDHNDPADVVVIPHAHQAGNYRLSDPKLEPIIEIMSQHGTFEWFAKAYLRHGQQVGFTAASDNHLSQPGYTAPRGSGLAQRGGLGAVLAPEHSRDAIFDALKAARAYATTGDRIIMDVTLNGATMGQRIPFTEERNLHARIVATAPIDTVTIVKNGDDIWWRDYGTPTDYGFGQTELLDVTFESPAVPMHKGDNPRGWRPWSGTIEVEGANLVDAVLTDLVNPDMQRFELDDAGIVHFSTITRGDTSSVRLTLTEIEKDAHVRVVLEEGTEVGAGPPIFRAHATLPAATVELPFSELWAGAVEHKLPFDIYEDTVTLRRIRTNGPDDIEFDFEETGTIHGDYYYVRVKLVDEAMAWSSPVWVGGYPSR